ncbi:hypothetical protein GCM10023085_81800 [Actinomadura viridis]
MTDCGFIISLPENPTVLIYVRCASAHNETCRGTRRGSPLGALPPGHMPYAEIVVPETPPDENAPTTSAFSEVHG